MYFIYFSTFLIWIRNQHCGLELFSLNFFWIVLFISFQCHCIPKSKKSKCPEQIIWCPFLYQNINIWFCKFSSIMKFNNVIGCNFLIEMNVNKHTIIGSHFQYFISCVVSIINVRNCIHHISIPPCSFSIINS